MVGTFGLKDHLQLSEAMDSHGFPSSRNDQTPGVSCLDVLNVGNGWEQKTQIPQGFHPKFPRSLRLAPLSP